MYKYLAGILVASFAVLLVPIIQYQALAQTEINVAEHLIKARDLHENGKFKQSLKLTVDVLQEPNLGPHDSIAIYEMQGLIYFSMGVDRYDKAQQCLQKISEIGPCLIRLPRNFWPRGFCTKWYDIARPIGAMPCSADTESTNISTIAVYDFDNHSITKYKEELGDLGAGLATFFQHDFGKISDLTMVERDKIAYIIKEDSLAKSGYVDQETAVKAGRILGVHLMVFGSFTQISSKVTTMSVRVVNVETSEIIASAVTEGRPNYFKLEKHLVQELCDQLEITLSKDERKEVESGGTSSMDATSAYATGLKYEDKHEYELAYEFFSKAIELDPEFEEARVKMTVYKPLVS